MVSANEAPFCFAGFDAVGITAGCAPQPTHPGRDLPAVALVPIPVLHDRQLMLVVGATGGWTQPRESQVLIMNYASRTRLITGAASGPGLAIAQAFAAERASTAEGAALPTPQGR